MENELDKIREKINGIDKQMAELFEERMKLGASVAEYKIKNGLPVFDKSREAVVINKNSAFITDPQIKEYYVNFIQNNMDLSKKYQTRIMQGMRVAYTGVEGAFAHIACKQMFPSATYVPYTSFESAYNSVANGDNDVVVLPIENSFAGDVEIVSDLMFSGSLFLTNVLELPVVHNLVAKKGVTKADIKTVISHPQALAQCSEYTTKNGYETLSYPNTAMASKYVAESNDKTIAAIASNETARLYGLEILESNVNSSRTNTTRFAAFARCSAPSSLASKDSQQHFIITFTTKNEAGSLAKTLDIIGAHGFNMRALRSRPMKGLLWNYYFYIEADGNINSADGQAMMRQLNAICDKLKLVGIYKDEVK